jgi:transglutaminase-like putative cysteine protease
VVSRREYPRSWSNSLLYPAVSLPHQATRKLIITGEAVFDPIAAALVWSIMVWIVAAWAGWIVEARRNALLAVLPAVLLSLGTLSYGGRESFTLYLMLGSTLLLLATVQHERREQGWNDSDTAYPPRKGRQIGSSALVLTVVLVAFSAIVSSISLPRILERVSALREPAPAQEGSLAKSLGIMPAATASPDPFEGVRRPGLPREKLIGSGSELSKRTVMTVAVEDFPAIFKGRQAQPFYWRSFTYDVYTGHGWRTSSTRVSEHQASEPLQTEQVGSYILVRQTMRFAGGKVSALYAVGEPLNVDQTSAAAWRSPEDLFGIQISSAASYRASSLFPVVSEGVLRAAGQRYPDWVRERFLALPSDVPDRVKELAFQLTASEPTPYDRARAIERHLRTIPYTLDVPYPPLDQDLVDFFLYDLRQGYCDYYASAMVVLARAAGVPARIAVGYANGTYNLNAKHFLVTEADAHSWVEVYFPNIGWVPFEPTAGRPPLENAQRSDSAVMQNLEPDRDKLDANGGITTPGVWLFLLAGLTMMAVAIMAWVAFDELRLRRLSVMAAADEIYKRMRRYATRLGVTLEPGNTPSELAASLTSHLLLSHLVDSPEPEHISPAIEQVRSITDGIVQVSFCPYPIFEGGKDAIYRQWRSLRWQLLVVWVKGGVQALRDRLGGILTGIIRNNSVETLQET